jgi:hypothetical protein
MTESESPLIESLIVDHGSGMSGTVLIPTPERRSTMATFANLSLHNVTKVTIEPPHHPGGQSYVMRKIIIETMDGDFTIDLFSKYVSIHSDDEPSLPITY